MTERAFACMSGSANYLQEGMSLRDYFAAQAMIAYISFPEKHTCINHEQMAALSYQAADAMMKVGEEQTMTNAADKQKGGE